MPSAQRAPAQPFNDVDGYQHIPLQPVSSSQIRAIGHDPERSMLAIQFNHGAMAVYQYPGVSADTFKAFQAAKSIGTFFGQHIKDLAFSKYPASVLEDQQDAQAVTPASIAALLNGVEYSRDVVSHEIAAQAKAAGILIVYGASDDLIEFDGAWSDEAGAGENTEVMIDATGVLPSWETVKDEDNEELAAEWHVRKRGARIITTLWAPKDDDGNEYASWAYTTDIPHSTFDVMEDGELYCRGICLAVADLSKA